MLSLYAKGVDALFTPVTTFFSVFLEILVVPQALPFFFLPSTADLTVSGQPLSPPRLPRGCLVFFLTNPYSGVYVESFSVPFLCLASLSPELFAQAGL